ncbi:MAG: 3'-5' exonuclease [Fermentimonas sp.]|nr:3'-5' exonuclease [Fermentimonas sp.]
MKLFIYERFWDAFLKLNKTTQTKVTGFISKFRTDSKSAAINLESISTFKDQSLRTARVDDKYRAIIKEVKASNVYLLVWIDNHDDAMEWAKNKVIDWNEQTKAYQVFTIDESVEIIAEKQVDSAVSPLFMGKYGYKDLLEIGVPQALVPSVLYINNFSALEDMMDYLPNDAFENLFYLLDGANIESLKSEIKNGLETESDDELNSKNNARSFFELTDDVLFNEALQGPLQKWKYYLHPSQSSLVNRDFNGAVKLSGGAGTGKTVVALHRLKYLAENKTNGKPILFTTFTKELSKNLESLAAELKVKSGTYRIENIDALAFELANEYRLIESNDRIIGLSNVKSDRDLWSNFLDEQLVAYDEEFLKSEFDDVILTQNVQTLQDYLKASRVGRGRAISRRQRIELWEVFEAFNVERKNQNLLYKEEIYNLVSSYLNEQNISVFSHVIVDELQDFSNVELNFIRSLVKEGVNDLFMVGDPLQNIFNKKIVFSRSGINIRGQRSKRLRINYRTTEEIKKLAISIIQDEEFDDFDGGKEDKTGYLSLFHGVKPEYKVFDDKQKELDFVFEEITNLIEKGVYYNEIVIAARTRDSVKDFTNKLHQEGMPYITRDLLNPNNEGVRLTTFHGIKGLEFKHVFLTDVNKRTLPFLPYNFNSLTEVEKQEILKKEKSLFYVASSRAIQRLVISGIGEKSELVKI